MGVPTSMVNRGAEVRGDASVPLSICACIARARPGAAERSPAASNAHARVLPRERRTMAAAAPDPATAPEGDDDEALALRTPPATSAKARKAAEAAAAAAAFARLARCVLKRVPHHAAGSNGQSAISSVNVCVVLAGLLSQKCTPNNVCTPSQLGNPALGDLLTLVAQGAAVKFASTGKNGKGVLDSAFRDFGDPREVEHALLEIREVDVTFLAAGLDNALPGVRDDALSGRIGAPALLACIVDPEERVDALTGDATGVAGEAIGAYLRCVRPPPPSDSPQCVFPRPQTPIGMSSCEHPPPAGFLSAGRSSAAWGTRSSPRRLALPERPGRAPRLARAGRRRRRRARTRRCRGAARLSALFAPTTTPSLRCAPPLPVSLALPRPLTAEPPFPGWWPAPISTGP